ncbi:hypothetical protein ACLMJK_009601 [Lecanora helva]
MAFFDNMPAGEVATRLTTDMETIRIGTSEKVGLFISSFAYLVGAYIVAFLKAPRLAGILTFMIPAYILMVVVGGRYIGRFTAQTSYHLAAAASLVSQSLSNVPLIHALSANDRLEKKLGIILKQAQTAALKKNIAAATQFGFMFLIAYSANAVAFWQGGREISGSVGDDSSILTVGAVYTVIFVLLDASFVISQVAPFLQIFGAATASAGTLESVVNSTSSVGVPADHSEGALLGSGNILFKDVTFAYPSRRDNQVLNGVSLKLTGGEHTAIVGSSGSGKSTVAGLVTRLYEASAGSILVDDVEVASIDAQRLRHNIGVVDQDPAILCCSVLENIAFGLVNETRYRVLGCSIGRYLAKITKDARKGQSFQAILQKESPGIQGLVKDIGRASDLADAHSFIQNLPFGYATIVGPGGIELSGGQRQRLALARAIVKNPPILLLDEATSALDSVSEQKILNSLKELRSGRTTVTIAHRLVTIKDADKIIVMDEGRVAEEGSHDELLSRQGLYAAMTESQSLQVPKTVSTEPSEVSTATSCSLADIKAIKFKSASTPIRGRSRSWSADAKMDRHHDTSDHRSNVRTVAILVRPQLLMVLVGIIGSIVAGGAYSGDAVIFGNTIGNLDICRGASKINHTGDLAGILFFLLALAAFFANSIGGSAFGKVAEKVVSEIRILTFRALFQQDLLWHTSDDRTPAQLLSYFTTDTHALAGLSGVVIGTILTILVNLVASIIMTHIIAWKIAVVLLATLPILLGSGFMRLYVLGKLQATHQKLYATSAGISLEAVASIKTIANYCLEAEFHERYCRSLRGPYKASLREFAYTNFWLAAAYSITFFIYALAYWWGSKQIIAGVYSQAQFFIVLPALLFSAQSCGQMFALAPDVSHAHVAAKRVFELINSRTERGDPTIGRLANGETSNTEKDPEKALDETQDPAPDSQQKGMACQMHSVSFAYPTRPDKLILDKLTLSVQAGEFCALVGPSGAGKSTIISLLESFYQPSSGTIYLDNRAISSTSSVPHRSSMSLVPQASTLFSDTINFNISLGAHPSHNPSDDEVIEACKLANIHPLIETLPDGYQTQCGANSSHFSGGQKQRLCIARALVRKPRMLLLDEPTSALDAESEVRLHETIEGLRGRMTIVVVAHRLCTIQKADRIFWIEGGTCTHSGTHAELLLSCPGYRESAIHQAL